MTTQTLRVGPWTVAFRGLDAALAMALQERWGPFAGAADAGEPAMRVEVQETSPSAGLGHWSPGERYRVEAVPGPGIPTVRSYGFVLRATAPATFTLGLVPGVEEPATRRLDNAARLLVARLALGAGGFAMHAAGVLDGTRAHLLAGPSRSGKTTAVAALRWPSLGDDFAVVVPRGNDGWAAVATPFDNAEAVPASAPTGAWPLAAVWRLAQEPSGALRTLPATAAATMLTACAAFPWALPDMAEPLVTATVRCAREVRCGVLAFARDTDLRALLAG